MALYLLLPNPLILGPGSRLPLLELALFVPLVLANPKRMTQETKVLRLLSIGLVLLIALANTVALVLLVRPLVNGQTRPRWAAPARRCAGVDHQHDRLCLGVLGARSRWASRAYPRSRAVSCRRPTSASRRTRTTTPSSRWPLARPLKSGWSPGFVDYLYVSVTNSSAFSPTDTMPLSHRAKMLMATESVSALVLSVIVIARGVEPPELTRPPPRAGAAQCRDVGRQMTPEFGNHFGVLRRQGGHGGPVQPP